MRIRVVAFFLFVAAIGATAQQAAGPKSDAAAHSKLQIAFTFDDIPAHGPLPPGVTRADVIKKIVAALEAAKVPAYGFLNGAWLEQAGGADALPIWVSSGFPLGNHTWSHMNLNQHAAEEFEREIAENEPLLQKSAGNNDWHWFRYPFLAEGDAPQKRSTIRAYLAQHGYRVAAVTMSFGDYMWNEPYARCAAKNDSAAIRILEDSYLKAAKDAVAYSRAASQQLYQRDIPYVLLMHVGAFDAAMLPRLIRLYRSEGVDFVTLSQAEQDGFYRYSTDLASGDGPDTLESALAEKHLAPPPQSKPTVNLDMLCR